MFVQRRNIIALTLSDATTFGPHESLQIECYHYLASMASAADVRPTANFRWVIWLGCFVLLSRDEC